jgi:hypothetical protein
VHRDITTSYANRPEVKTATRSFDLMLCPGERGPLEHHNIIETLPWVLLDACELLSRDAARAELGHHDDRPLAVVCDTTKPSESTGLKHLARHLEQAYGDAVRVIHAKLEETWPLMSLHRGIDLLIGAAGYNTVHEARLTGTTLRAIPRQRLYDCQDRRLMPRELLEDSDPPPIRAKQECTTYSNGAHDAILGIEGFVSR